MSSEILIVDDERQMLESLSLVLSEAGYRVRTAQSGELAISAVEESAPSLVLLDVMMPGMSGLETCRRLRERHYSLPIIFLTALDTPADELRALASGGDTYIVKTVPEEVLVARIAALLRLQHSSVAADDETGDFDFGSWRVLASRQTMQAPRGRAVPLVDREIAFMRMLATHPGEVFSREEIVNRLWGGDSETTDNNLSVLLYRLRRKLGRSGDAISSVRGAGYAYRLFRS